MTTGTNCYNKQLDPSRYLAGERKGSSPCGGWGLTGSKVCLQLWRRQRRAWGRGVHVINSSVAIKSRELV